MAVSVSLSDILTSIYKFFFKIKMLNKQINNNIKANFYDLLSNLGFESSHESFESFYTLL